MSNNETQQTSMNAIYQRLTNVNISKQIDEWDARGKGYYGEFLLFSELYNYIPGCSKILMNLQIPSENGRTTEIDLLLIHETGLYVFEAKHYKSTIYGKMDDQKWTQYFKTVPNQYFPNPVLQNRWHIEQLRKLIPNCPIHSFIVFTSSECELKVTGNLPNTILCKKSSMCKRFGEISHHATPVLSMKEIDNIFVALKIYSPMQGAQIDFEDNKAVDLYQFMEMMSKFHNTQKTILEHNYQAKEEQLMQQYVAKDKANKNKLRQLNLLTIGICVATIFLLFVFTSGISLIVASGANTKVAEHQQKVDEYQKLMEQYRDDANSSQAELQKFMQKWEIITDFQIDGEKLKSDFVVVDSVNLKNSADFDDVVNLSFSITHNGEDFYVLIDKSSMFTIILKDGRIIETPCYSNYYSYSLGYSQSTKTLKVDKVEFSGFSAEDISLIKMTNMQIKRIKYVYNENPLLTDYEIVLYEAQ